MPDCNAQRSTSDSEEVFLINGGFVPTSTPLGSTVVTWIDLIRQEPHQKAKSGGMSRLRKTSLGLSGSALWSSSAYKFTARSTPMGSMHGMRRLKMAKLQ